MNAEKFRWQKQRRDESVEKIFKELARGGRTFTELLNLTGLSRAVLTKRLKSMRELVQIEKFLDKEGRVRYRLTSKAVSDYLNLIKISHFRTLGETSLFAPIAESMNQPEVNDVSFLEMFCKKIGALTLYTLLSVADMKSQKEVDHLLVNLFTDLDQKRKWFWYLWERMNIQDRSKPTITVADVYERMDKLLSYIPKDRLAEMRAALRQIYPEEVECLRGAMMKASLWVEIKKALQTGELDEKFNELPLSELYEKYVELEAKKKKRREEQE